MVSFKYGEWSYICRVSPQPICNLFFRQLLVHPERGVQAAPDPSLNLPSEDLTQREGIVKELGVGINPTCTIPRMEVVGGKLDSLGNVANIVLCCVSIFVVGWLVRKAFRRKAAVARVEIILLLIIYGLLKFFEIFANGGVLEQGSQSIVWLTGLDHSLLVVFFFGLIWLGFLGLQVVEDGSLFSLVPLATCSTFLFVASNYIFLDTGFGITHYFASQPADHLYSPWTFTMVILWPLIALTIYAGLTILVSVKVLGELKPVILLLCSLMTIGLAELFRWILSQPICHSSHGTVDGSFMGSLFELVSLGLLVYTWISLTEAEWDEYQDFGFGFPTAQPILQQQQQQNSFFGSARQTPSHLSPDDQPVIVNRPHSLDYRPDIHPNLSNTPNLPFPNQLQPENPLLHQQQPHLPSTSPLDQHGPIVTNFDPVHDPHLPHSNTFK
ncbi:hypothetical protein PGT21_050122 [Puccinia graminis f. sp. tritici]|uniref:Uncharacterized protein n=1 Tax=Puccinia graminis f. sp. tritici TaxID=56615 RepID=A0A5B0NXZ2_PUCGR|nr:hypothetical protein PGT21_050122 [Puccinia graminis f. sp. tritici]KAA1093526.1 hypothetical protein PGTUg99_025386 [Puccinia graminis f. sp. tritici]